MKDDNKDVDAVNMTQKCVDETAKSEHEPLYMDMSQVPTGMPDWKPGMVFPAPKREWVGLDGEIPGLGLVTEEFYNGMLFAEDYLREKNGG